MMTRMGTPPSPDATCPNGMIAWRNVRTLGAMILDDHGLDAWTPCEVESDDIADLLGEERVGGELEVVAR